MIETINEIVKYGLERYPGDDFLERDLEKQLVKLHLLAIDLGEYSDDTEYGHFDIRKLYPNVRSHVSSNFKDFGFYHAVVDIKAVANDPTLVIGDAIDDLSDIIYDLLEVKRRIDYNSKEDAWTFFHEIYHIHTKHHLINLIKYLSN